MYELKGIFVAGDWRQPRGEGAFEVIDPATESVLASMRMASPDDLDEALAAAQRGYEVWRGVSPWERGTLLHRVARTIREQTDAIAETMSIETGKPLAEARGEVGASADQFEWCAEEARRIYSQALAGREPGVRLDVRFEPVGPVAAFTAWNFPALLPSRKIAAALAAGCSVILKPSEETPATAMHIVSILQEQGLPPEAVQLVVGDPGAISSQLIASPIVRKVSLTGSAPVGRHIMRLCADGLKQLSLELGGHAPVLVFDDSDAEAAALACARAKFRNAGQVCVSPSRFFVQEGIYDAFTKQFAKFAKGLTLGSGLDPAVDMGPMINGRGRRRALDFIDDAVSCGAEVLAGGGAPAHLTNGYFVQPTVLGHVPDSARILSEEPFAPIAPIAPFSSFDEVVDRANGLPFGLAAYVFSRDAKTIDRAVSCLEAGMVGVNDLLLATAEAPFGGVKDSGFGREGGFLGIRDFLEPKYVKTRT